MTEIPTKKTGVLIPFPLDRTNQNPEAPQGNGQIIEIEKWVRERTQDPPLSVVACIRIHPEITTPLNRRQSHPEITEALEIEEVNRLFEKLIEQLENIEEVLGILKHAEELKTDSRILTNLLKANKRGFYISIHVNKAINECFINYTIITEKKEGSKKKRLNELERIKSIMMENIQRFFNNLLGSDPLSPKSEKEKEIEFFLFNNYSFLELINDLRTHLKNKLKFFGIRVENLEETQEEYSHPVHLLKSKQPPQKIRIHITWSFPI